MRMKRFAFLGLAFVLAFFMSACKEITDLENNNTNIVIMGPNGIPINEIKLCVGQSWKINLDIASLSVTSGDSAILSVKRDGNAYVVVGVRAGLTYLTFTNNTGSAPPFKVEVTDCGPSEPLPPDRVLTSIDYAPPGGMLNVGQQVQLVATCKDQHGVVMPCTTLTWISSTPNNVSVNQLSGLLTCNAVGQASVTVSTTNGLSKSYTFICQQTGQLVYTNQINTYLCTGFQQSWPITVTFGGSPITATGWTSSNTSVATVNASGVVTLTGTAGGAIVNAQTSAGPVVVTITANACPPPQSGITSITIITTPSGPFNGLCPIGFDVKVRIGGFGTFDRRALLTGTGVTLTKTSDSTWIASANASGQVVLTGTAVGNSSVTAQHQTSVTCTSQPSVISVDVQPPILRCPLGGQVDFHAVVNGNPSNTNVTWTSSDPNVAPIVARSSNTHTVTLRCDRIGQTDVKAISDADPTKSDIGVLIVEQPASQFLCTVSAINYTASSFDLGVNQTRTVSLDPAQNWSSNCDIIWYTPRPSILGVQGSDTIRIQGVLFYKGQNALFRGVWTGTTEGTAHLISKTTSGDWVLMSALSTKTWNVTATSSSTGNQVATAREFPELNFLPLDVKIDHDAQRRLIESWSRSKQTQ